MMFITPFLCRVTTAYHHRNSYQPMHRATFGWHYRPYTAVICTLFWAKSGIKLNYGKLFIGYRAKAEFVNGHKKRRLKSRLDFVLIHRYTYPYSQGFDRRQKPRADRRAIISIEDCRD